jgi:isovaleryl-CoA dehydrogenase
MYVAANAAKAYAYAVARACDDGRVTREDAAGAILYAAERATWMALETIQCLGGNGYINDFPAGRLLRDAKLYEATAIRKRPHSAHGVHRGASRRRP